MEHKKDNGYVCDNQCCEHRNWGGHNMCWHFIAKWVLAIIILGVVFAGGIKLGELKAILESRYGDFGNMIHYRWFPNPLMMMDGANSDASYDPGAPATIQPKAGGSTAPK